MYVGDNSSLPYCECKDWRRYKLLCKHFCVLIIKKHLAWDALSKQYINSVYFKIDEILVPRKEISEAEPSRADFSIFAKVPPVEESLNKKKSDSAVAADCRDALLEIKTLLHAVPVDSPELTEIRTSLLDCRETLKRIATIDSNLVVIPEESRRKYTPLKPKRKKKTKSDYNERVKKALISAMIDSDSD